MSEKEGVGMSEANRPLEIPRFMVSIEIFDNDRQQALVEEGFNTPTVECCIAALGEACHKLREFRQAAREKP